MEYLTLQKIRAYVIAYELSNHVWTVISEWDSFAKWTIGKQFAEAIDSISANIAEGFGRYHKKEKIHHYRYSFGSLEESKDWASKAIQRGLLKGTAAEHILSELNKLPIEINYLIKYTNEKLKY